MRLVRVGAPGRERPHILIEHDRVIDVSDIVGDVNEEFFKRGGFDLLRDAGEARSALAEPLAGRRLGSPIARPPQILCIGLNYVDHAHESGFEPPIEPVVFSKSPHSLSGPFDDVVMPRGSTKLDWEVELGIVIGRRASYLENEAEAMSVIGGYLLVNDVSERAFQLERSGQWLKGKSAETFHPAGPWLVSPDDVNLSELELWLDVNGRRMQNGSSSQMIFSVPKIIHYLSQFLVLEPGDIIDTGTPPGVALGRQPQPWLREGDVVELGITGLGMQRQTIVAAS